MPEPHIDRRQLRQVLRSRRRALSPSQQTLAARRLAQRLHSHAATQRARRIALYLACDGEIDPAIYARRASRRGRQVFLPVLAHFPYPHVHFRRWQAGSRLRRNRFGIGEPVRGRRLSARDMDIILLPLVGFTATGQRLGMGGGFYDRTLAFKKNTRRRPPLLLGLAHACQQVATLHHAPWDIPLDAVVTDTGSYRCRR